MIFCCGAYHVPQKTVFIMPDCKYKDRKLEVLVCPICGAFIAELIQYNVKTEKYETYRPKRKKTAKFIREVEEGKWQEVKIKYASKERAGFVFGVNREGKDGNIYQYSVDFNGQRKLVKVINK